MTNEQAFTMIEHAIVHLRQSDAYWHNEDYLPTERAINTLYEAHKAIGLLGQMRASGLIDKVSEAGHAHLNRHARKQDRRTCKTVNASSQ